MRCFSTLRKVLVGLLFMFVVNNSIGQLPNLPDSEKLYGLSLFWQEANYHFAFFDKQPSLNWDSAYKAFIPQVLATPSTYEYYRVMKRFCALLKDGHTNVYYPKFIQDSLDFPMLKLTEIDRHAIITEVGKPYEKEIPIGSEVIAVNGMATVHFLNQEIFPYMSHPLESSRWKEAVRIMLAGWSNSTVELQLKHKNEIRSVSVVRNRDATQWMIALSRPPLFQFEWLDHQIACIRLNGFHDPRLITLFKEKVNDLLQAKAVIIDIRKNGGGNSDIGAEILKYFTDARYFLGSNWKTPKHIATFRAWGSLFNPQGQDTTFKKYYPYANRKAWHYGVTDTVYNDLKGAKITVPVVVLTGTATVSAAEDFLIYFDYLKRGEVIGERTNGSTGQPYLFPLPGGGMARICTKRDTYYDGREFVGIGIVPHIEVRPTLEDYIANKDVIQLKAIEVLKSKIEK